MISIYDHVAVTKTDFKRHLPGEFLDFSWVFWSRHCLRKGARRAEEERKKKTKMTKPVFHRFHAGFATLATIASRWGNAREQL